MLDHTARWSLPHGNSPVPSRWQATRCARGGRQTDDHGRLLDIFRTLTGVWAVHRPSAQRGPYCAARFVLR